MRSATLSGHHRADDWIRTSIYRFTGPAPFSIEPRRHFYPARARGFEPRVAALETACPPTSTLVIHQLVIFACGPLNIVVCCPCSCSNSFSDGEL